MRKNYGSSLEVQLYLLVEAVFQVQLWRLGLHWLQLDGHVLVVVEVLAQSQLAKVAATDLLAHPEVGADHEDGGGVGRSAAPGGHVGPAASTGRL